MSKEEFQMWEKRIEACFRAAEQTTDNYMKRVWQQKAMYLLRKLNGSWVR